MRQQRGDAGHRQDDGADDRQRAQQSRSPGDGRDQAGDDGERRWRARGRGRPAVAMSCHASHPCSSSAAGQEPRRPSSGRQPPARFRAASAWRAGQSRPGGERVQGRDGDVE